MFDMTFKSISGLRAIVADPLVVVVELVLIGLSVNWIAGVLQGTRGTRPLRGVLTVLVVAALVINVLAERSGWERLSLLYEYFLFGLAFIALVAFQPELRRAVIRAGDVRFLRRGTPQSKVVAALVQSARYLSRNRYGGLVAIQRVVDLTSWAEKGTLLNAEVSANLLNSIFFPNSPLHDLGVIIAGKKVLAANCQFPLAESDEVDAAVGSRHLAAVGMSYETDALVLIVSEETGTLSLADGGRLTRFLSLDDLADELSSRLAGQTLRTPEDKHGPLPPLSHLWRFARRMLVVVPLTLVIWVLANQASQTTIEGVDVELAVRPRPPGYVVDIDSPSTRLFKAKFRGSARAIERLRERIANQPLRVSWVPSERDLIGLHERPALDLLNALDEVRELRANVEQVQPDTVAFTVDEVVTVTMALEADTGTVQSSQQQFEPATVRVGMRKRHVDGLAESKRVLKLPLYESVHNLAPGTVFKGKVAVPDKVGECPIISKDCDQVAVTLGVGGQRIVRQVPLVPVWITISPELLQVYEVERLDPQEWLIEVDLEGERSQIEALRPQDVRAFVAISSDLLNPAPVLRLEAKIDAPEGVKVVGNRHFVQLRLTRREGRSP